MSLFHFLLHLLSQICSQKTAAAIVAHVFPFIGRLLTGFLRQLSSHMSFFVLGLFPRFQIIAINKCEQLLCTFTCVLFMFSPLTFFYDLDSLFPFSSSGLFLNPQLTKVGSLSDAEVLAAPCNSDPFLARRCV